MENINDFGFGQNLSSYDKLYLDLPTQFKMKEHFFRTELEKSFHSKSFDGFNVFASP